MLTVFISWTEHFNTLSQKGHLAQSYRFTTDRFLGVRMQKSLLEYLVFSETSLKNSLDFDLTVLI